MNCISLYNAMMPFIHSIAGPVDGTAIYMAWLVLDFFLPLLILLLSFKFCRCLPPLSIIYMPHIHILTISSSLSTCGCLWTTDDAEASSSAPLQPLSSSARGRARDSQRC